MKTQGNIIVLLAIMLAAILPLLGLAIGTGSIYVNRTRVQNSANLAALSGLQTFTSSENLLDPALTRANKALAAVNALLAKNKPFLSTSALPAVSLYGTSEAKPTLSLGNYSESRPAYCSTEAADSECDAAKCPKGYPCFIPYLPSELENKVTRQKINAVKLDVTTRVSSFIAPFLNLVGSVAGGTQFSTTAVSSLLPRCAVFLLDVSNSSFQESHFKLPLKMFGRPATALGTDGWGTIHTDTSDLDEDSNQWDVTFPLGQSLKYRVAPQDATIRTILTDGSPGPIDRAYQKYLRPSGLGNYAIPISSSGPVNCQTDIHADQGTDNRLNDGRAYWCSMKTTRPPECLSGVQPVGCNWTLNRPCCAEHYQSDYRISDTPSGRFEIDRFNLPEPFNSFLEATNSALRQILATQTAQDGIAVMAFSGSEHAAVPAVNLTSDTRFAIDLTDMRRGMDLKPSLGSSKINEEIHPNYLDRDWFPINVAGNSPKSGTDILRVLYDATNRLSNPAFCPSNAQKTIFLASDGVITNYQDIVSPNVNWDAAASHDIESGADGLNAEIAVSYPRLNNGLRALMVNNKIRFVMLLAGNKVNPNFTKVQKSNPPGGPPIFCSEFTPRSCQINNTTGDFYAPWELPSLGVGGLFTDPNMAQKFSNRYVEIPDYFRKYTPPCTCEPRYLPSCVTREVNECARLISPYVPNLPFNSPNGTFSELAVATNGLFCPLMEPYRTSYPNGPIDKTCYDQNTGLRKPNPANPNCSMTKGTDVGYENTSGAYQTRSIIQGEKGQQASFCSNLAFGTPAFSLNNLASASE